MALPTQFTAPNPAEYGGDEVAALVLDPGYSTTRAGFAGEDTPKSVVPTSYGVNTKSGASAHGLFGDNALHDPQPNIEIRNPLAGEGAEDWVADWDVASKLWEYSITSRLTGVKLSKAEKNGTEPSANGEENGDVKMDDAEQNEGPVSENPLLMSEPGRTSVKSREKIIELAMETWGSPAFYLARSGVLAAFSAGRPTALVVDIGASMMSITPVIDGMILKKGVKTSPLGGNYVSQQIRLMFASSQPPVPLVPHYMVSSKIPVDAGQPSQAIYRKFETPPTESFRQWEEERVLTEFKESVVQIWPGPGRLSTAGPQGSTNEDVAKSQPSRPFEMPDGWNQVFGVERFKPAESLFDEKAAFSDEDHPRPKPEQTLINLINSALTAVDQDIRPNLLNNIVLVGGSSLLPGFTRRLESELNAQYPGPRVRMYAASNTAERKYATWIGGSILASLGSFHQLWISKKEYEEHGVGIVEKRSK